MTTDTVRLADGTTPGPQSSPLANPLVYAVVLAWNQLSETLECLASLQQTLYHPLHVLLVDNGSSDGTADEVARQFPAVEIARLPENVGIARGYNAGVEIALERQAEYVMVMNNDTIAAPDLVGHLVQAFRDHPKAGMLMPKI